MQKITPFLWFEEKGEEAVDFYVSIFKNSKVSRTTHYGDAVPSQKGKVMSVEFQIEGQDFTALNGGPVEGFKFSPAISLFVNCEDQAEVDALWSKLSEGGNIMPCGWVTDKYGVTWQIIPKALGELMNDPDPQKSQRVMAAMLKMKKIEVEELEKAYKGE